MIDVLFVRASHSARLASDNVQRPFRVAQSLLDDSVIAYLESSERFRVETLQVDLQPYAPQGAWCTSREVDGPGASTFAVNLPFLREALHGLTAAIRMLIWAQARRRSPKVLLLMTNFPPVALALRAVARRLGVPRVVTLTDLASFSYSPERVAAAPRWKRPWLRAYARRVESLEQSYDGYVLLTQQMNEVVNEAGRPHVVVEGVLNPQGMQWPAKEVAGRGKVIAHAGTLDRLYGIEHLLDVFACIEDPDAELWLFGTGDMDAAIRRRQELDRRIVFHGFQPRADVFVALQQADLLVNLRDPAEHYTQYSFPSKLFEYMASGTPVATTLLPGIPESYAPFLFGVHSMDPVTVAGILQQVLALPPGVLEARGSRAREFVLTHKTAESQCRRIDEILVHVTEGGEAP